jgi:hypothetical protein
LEFQCKPVLVDIEVVGNIVGIIDIDNDDDIVGYDVEGNIVACTYSSDQDQTVQQLAR